VSTQPPSAHSARGEPTSFERGLRVLLAISEGGQVKVNALVEQLGLPPSTVYRYLRPLRELGLVRESDGYYRVGERLLTADRGLSNVVLAHLARPTLQTLSRDSGETALLTIRVGMSVMCLAQAESANPVRMAFEVGQVLPLQAGAASRVLLAYAPAKVVEAVFAGGLLTYTPNTPDLRKLRRQLESIRTLGFATSRGEFIPGAFAVAVPVFHGDSVIAGLALAGPANRCSHQWQVTARPLLVEAGLALSSRLG
jgi:DNA-binding IclR family transcriptional regulator